MIAQHSSKNDDWLTPIWLVNSAKQVLGEIDLDPASSPEANVRVGAKKFYTKEEEDGLTKEWRDTIFCNPPGGKVKGKSVAALFWTYLMQEIKSGNVNHAIFICFSAEALQNTQGKGVPSVGEYPFCIPAKRIHFDYPGSERKKAPTHGNVIVYVPGIVNNTRLFVETFKNFGVVIGASKWIYV